jgi:dihydrofolate reductase
MRRIIMFNHVSADGYFSAPDGSLNWVVQDPEIGKTAAEASESEGTGTILFGRRTYEQFESFWPNALDDSSTSANPHSGRGSPELRAMAVYINDATKIVFSKSRKDVTWKNSKLLRELDPQAIEALKREPGKDIMIFGSGSIVAQLSQHKLIDEYQFIVSPLLLGNGQSMIRDMPDSVRLKLRDATSYDSGNVMLRYAPAR